MIIGNLNHLSLAGLPAWVRNILLRPECSLSALSTREDGRWQPEGMSVVLHAGNFRHATRRTPPYGIITIYGPIYRW